MLQEAADDGPFSRGYRKNCKYMVCALKVRRISKIDCEERAMWTEEDTGGQRRETDRRAQQLTVRMQRMETKEPQQHFLAENGRNERDPT